MNKDIEQTDKQQKEPLLPDTKPDKPWIYAATDIFTLNNKNYLVVTGHYSSYQEAHYLNNMTSKSEITHFKSIFCRIWINK